MKTNRINITVPLPVNEILKKYQEQTNTDSLPQVYRWLIEGAVLLIEEKKVSPMIKALQEINEK